MKKIIITIIIAIIIAIIICCSLFLFFRRADNYNPLNPVSELQYIKNNKSFSDEFILEKTINLNCTDVSILKGIFCYKIIKDKMVMLTAGIEQKVLVFDTLGNQLISFGKKGQGPDEFSNSFHLDIDENYIYIYDLLQNKILLFDFNGKFQSTFKITGRYSSLTVNNGKLFLRRQLIPKKKYAEDIIDVYNISGKYLYAYNIPIKSITNRSKILYAKNYGLIIDKNALLISSCDDYLVYKYDMLNEKLLYRSNYLPSIIKLIDFNIESKSHEEVKKWFQKNSIFWGMWQFNNNVILLKIDDNLVLYDSNGNYLNDYYANGNIYTTYEDKLYEIKKIIPDVKNNNVTIVVNIFNIK